MSDKRLKEIIASYKKPIFCGGMTGAAQVMYLMACPPSQEMKANAAEMILAHRRCVKANAKNGKKYRGDFWLNKSRIYRQRALEALEREREKKNA